MFSNSGLSVSVVIAAYNAEGYLARCLSSLMKSEKAIRECIVVDDASTDNSAQVAARYGARVIPTGSNRGQAYARNLGTAASTGDIVVFLDSDTCVHPDTIGRIAARLESEPDLDAVFGSYDDYPAAPGFVSQFRNLLHCFVHQTSRPSAWTFWSGCGAVRRPVLEEHGGFDVSFRAVEDIELGYRLSRAGKRIALDRDIQVQHLKAWSLSRMVTTDVLSRGVPWTRLILGTWSMPNDLNLRWNHRLSVAASMLFQMLALAALLWFPFGGNVSVSGALLVGLAATLGAVLALNRAFCLFLARKRGWLFALCAAPLEILHYCCCGAGFLIGAAQHARAALSAAFERSGLRRAERTIPD